MNKMERAKIIELLKEQWRPYHRGSCHILSGDCKCHFCLIDELASVEQGEQMKPKRIQRKRIKGWKMPPNTLYVGRPSRWGNPYTVGENYFGTIATTKGVMSVYEDYIKRCLKVDPKFLNELRGKNLACWCPLEQSCHADVLLEIANRETI